MNLRDLRNNVRDLSQWEGFNVHYNDPTTCAKIVIDEINNDEIYSGIFNIHSREDMVIVDIGANVGLFTLFMYPICKKIYSIEPTPSHQTLLENMKSTYNLKNCVISKCAISDKTGTIQFNTNSGNSTMNSLVGPNTYDNSVLSDHQKDSFSGYDGKIDVETFNLCDYFDKNEITSVDFMKLDIEGGEQLVIFSEGFQKSVNKIRTMYIEIHEGLGANKETLLSELSKYFPNVYEMSYQANPGFYLTK